MDVNITATTSGWAAFGLNVQPSMVGGDVVMAYVAANGSAVVRAVCTTCTRVAAPSAAADRVRRQPNRARWPLADLRRVRDRVQLA